MKKAIFNPNGNELWITVKMQGLYYMAYTYRLWGTNADPHAVLTNPVPANNNTILIDDLYKINNDYLQMEPISKHHNRAVYIDLDVIKLKDDNGYNITISVWQADKMQIQTIIENLYNDQFIPPFKPLATESRNANLDTQSSVNENFWFLLADTTINQHV